MLKSAGEKRRASILLRANPTSAQNLPGLRRFLRKRVIRKPRWRKKNAGKPQRRVEKRRRMKGNGARPRRLRRKGVLTKQRSKRDSVTPEKKSYGISWKREHRTQR